MMFNRLSITLIATVLFVSFNSCRNNVHSKQAYLNEYEDFIEEVRKKQEKYSEEDWNKKDEEFSQLSDELFKKFEDELSILEKAKIGTYALTYGSVRAVNAISNALESEELEASIEDLKEVWDEDLKDKLEDKMDELKDKLEDEDFRVEINDKLVEIRDLTEDEEIKEKLEGVLAAIEEFVDEIEKKSK